MPLSFITSLTLCIYTLSYYYFNLGTGLSDLFLVSVGSHLGSAQGLGVHPTSKPGDNLCLCFAVIWRGALGCCKEFVPILGPPGAQVTQYGCAVWQAQGWRRSPSRALPSFQLHGQSHPFSPVRQSAVINFLSEFPADRYPWDSPPSPAQVTGRFRDGEL